MGCAASKRYAEMCAESRVISARMLALEEEVRETKRKRLQEALAHRRHLAALARRHEEVVGALEKRLLAEEGGRRPALEAAAEPGGGVEEVKRELRWLGASRQRAEQARRDQAAAERWKQLYLAIKAELDGLIIRTKQGEGLCWIVGGDVIGKLRKEVKAKDETIEGLRSRLEATEKEKAERDRKIDIMKQSLRILSCGKKRRSSACWRKNLATILRQRF